MTSAISSSASSLLSAALFAKLDTKKQGYLEKTDLETAMSSIDGSDSSSSSTDNVDQLFTSMDSNQDGKVTQDEMSTAINNVLDQLNGQLQAAGSQAASAAPPPPPPSTDSADDQGYTEDQLTTIASTTKDDKLASLMTQVAANFDSADTNHDGKVTGAEAIAYKKSTEESSSSTASSSATSSTGASNDDQIIAQIQKLISAYATTSANQATSTVSVAA
jgi:Ca2+-binding EF-hand superfamily protein